LVLAGLGAAVAAHGVAVVALLAVGAVAHAVAAPRTEHARVLAAAVAAGVLAVVALLAEEALHHAVAAVGAELAAGRARRLAGEAVRAEVHPVVAGLLVLLQLAVAAARAGRA